MNHIKLLDQFRSFYFRNYPQDMETQISYFSIFGGLGFDIDTSKPLEELIHEYILKNFDILQEKIKEITHDEANNKRLLRALAIGDRRIFSAFNRAGLNNGNGGAALKFLQEQGVVTLEYSREADPKQEDPKRKLKREVARHRISDKVLFTQPFMRFWFYFIAPHKREIANKDYKNFFKDFHKKHNSYTSLIFEEISQVLLNYNIRDSQIESSGSYWDANIEIDILTITDTDKIYIAECKWTNHFVNKNELRKLQDKCKKLEIEPTQIVFFSKRGFSKELLSMRGAELALYTAEDFAALLKNKKEDSFIENFLL
jgi:hypothetical protein